MPNLPRTLVGCCILGTVHCGGLNESDPTSMPSDTAGASGTSQEPNGGAAAGGTASGAEGTASGAEGTASGAEGTAGGALQTAGQGGDSSLEADRVSIIRGDPAQPEWLTLTVEGSGLTADEGRLFTLRIGHPDRAPERLASAQTRVEDGALSIVLADSNERSLYKRRVGFMDVNGDGICTAGIDRVYSDSRAMLEDSTLTLADSMPAPASNQFERARAEEGPCEILNGAWPLE